VELAIDFGGTEIKVGLARNAPATTTGPVSADAHTADASSIELIDTTTIPVRGDERDLAAAATAVRALLAEARDSGRTIEPLEAAGIAVPGVVDRDGRMLHANAKYDHFRDFDLTKWARVELDVGTVAVENDARAALVGETVAGGAAAGCADVVLVTLGTGIGTAAMVDGRLMRGSHGHAGILGGHVTVDLDAPLCPCGNVGCAESLASTWALQRESGTDASDLRALFAEGVSRTSETSAIAARYLRVWGAALVTLCHMYDPEIIVLSGGVMRAGERVRAPLEEYLHAHLWPSAHRPPLRIPAEPQFSVLRGLARLAHSTTKD
jgi:glucokinase